MHSIHKYRKLKGYFHSSIFSFILGINTQFCITLYFIYISKLLQTKYFLKGCQICISQTHHTCIYQITNTYHNLIKSEQGTKRSKKIYSQILVSFVVSQRRLTYNFIKNELHHTCFQNSPKFSEQLFSKKLLDRLLLCESFYKIWYHKHKSNPVSVGRECTSCT